MFTVHSHLSFGIVAILSSHPFHSPVFGRCLLKALVWVHSSLLSGLLRKALANNTSQLDKGFGTEDL